MSSFLTRDKERKGSRHGKSSYAPRRVLRQSPENVVERVDHHDAIAANEVAGQLSRRCSSAHAGSCLSASNASLAALPFF